MIFRLERQEEKWHEDEFASQLFAALPSILRNGTVRIDGVVSDSKRLTPRISIARVYKTV